ncbi:small ribosomal subunit biogenesis GTPase RsgA [Candidatus Profftia tarda]
MNLLAKNNNSLEMDYCSFSEQQEGIIICMFGNHADLKDTYGIEHRCHIRRTIQSLVTGDRVLWRAGTRPLMKGVIEAVHERQSVLMQSDCDAASRPMAANINQIVIVLSIFPRLSLDLIDKYLVACETIKIEPLIVLNKIDLIGDRPSDLIEEAIDIYRRIGYRILILSSNTKQGITALKNELAERISIFIGQSGVGKSTLINSIIPGFPHPIIIGSGSQYSSLGTHTTTATRLYDFPQGGNLIDSPGIRDFSLWHIDSKKIILGFIEFRKYLGTCQFRNCKHQNDPGCALRAAIREGEITQERFSSYHSIIKKYLR